MAWCTTTTTTVRRRTVVVGALLARWGCAREYVLDLTVEGEARELRYNAGDDLWSKAIEVVGNQRTVAPSCCAEGDACAAAVLVELLAAPVELEAPSRRGCRLDVPDGVDVGLLVAVPSARANQDRRDAIRATWCRHTRRARHGNHAAAAVRFFVGEVGPRRADVAVERALYDDIVQIQGLVDSATNVTAKLLASMAWFARLPAKYTHFARLEDDVYLFDDRLLFELRRLSASPSRPQVLGSFYSDGDWLRYPRGFAVVVPRAVAAAVAATHDGGAVGYEVFGEAEERKPDALKGAWVRSRWWHDDAFLGLVLYPLRVDFREEPRFHDLPGRGPAARRPSPTSFAVNGVQTRDEFDALARGAVARGLGVHPTAWRTGKNGAATEATVVVDADVDGHPVAFSMRRATCAADARANAAEVCTRLVPQMPEAECAAIDVALRAVCDAAADADDDETAASWTLGLRPGRSTRAENSLDDRLPALNLVRRSASC